MSEGSWLPKTWGDAIPQVFWGVIILGFGLEFCVSVLDANYGRALLAAFGLAVLLAMLIHQEQLRQRLMTISPNWIAAAFVVFLAAIVLSPFIEEKRWPLSAWFPPAQTLAVIHNHPTAEEIANATVPIRMELDAEKRKSAKLQSELDSAIRQRDAAPLAIQPTPAQTVLPTADSILSPKDSHDERPVLPF